MGLFLSVLITNLRTLTRQIISSGPIILSHAGSSRWVNFPGKYRDWFTLSSMEDILFSVHELESVDGGPTGRLDRGSPTTQAL